MTIFSTIGVAIKGLNHNRLRGFLSILGVVIGVMAVIGMSSLAKSMEMAFSAQASQMGANTFTIEKLSQIEMAMNWSSGDRQALFDLWRRPRLDLDYIDDIREDCKSVKSVAPVANIDRRFRHGKKRSDESYNVIATNEDFLQGGIYELADGRFLTENDILRRRYVCVIGKEVAEEFFPGMDPIGEEIRIGPLPCKVVGLLESVGSTLGANPDQVAIVPITAAVKHWRWLIWHMKINVEAEPGMMGSAEDEVVTTMRRLRSLRPEDDNDFSIVTSEMMEALFGKITGAAAFVVILIAAVSLFVAGIGIMNVMFVAVRERTKEIGIRKACGASSRQVLMQFAIEAILLSSVGGIIGMAIVVGAANAFGSIALPAENGAQASLDLVVPLSLIIMGLVFSFLVGVVFGIIPARKASKLNVVDALRYE